MKVQTALEPWPAPAGAALAGVSSFGFGGTNAHVVMAEAPPVEVRHPRAAADEACLLALSASSAGGLRRLGEDVAAFLDARAGALDLREVAASAARRRTHGRRRLAILARTIAEARRELRAFLDGQPGPCCVEGEARPPADRKVAFVFPGQGGQWWGMGRDLLAHDSTFRAHVEECDALFRPIAGWSLLDELGRDEATSRVHDTACTQPLLFALQTGLFACWRRLGVEPDLVVGHSAGEVSAAFASGRLSLAEGLHVAFHRARLMSRAEHAGGAMLAVALPVDEARRVAAEQGGRVAVAANNAPRSCVLSGDRGAIERIGAALTGQGVFCREVRVRVAGHGPAVDPILDELARAIGPVPRRAAAIPLLSTVTAADAAGLDLDGAYWARNVREPVLFHAATEVALSLGCRVFIELGPHPVLPNAIAETAAAVGQDVEVIHSLQRDRSDREALLAAVGRAHVFGLPVEWSHLFPDAIPFVPLPPAPFDRRRCWLDVSPPVAPVRAGDDLGHPLLLHRILSAADPAQIFFESRCDRRSMPWLGDHRVQGHAVLPATGHLELMRAALARALGRVAPSLSDVRFQRALVVGDEEARLVQIVVHKTGPHTARVQIYSRPDDEEDAAFTLHASAEAAPAASTPGSAPLASIRARCATASAPAEHYAAYRSREIDYRGLFASVRSVAFREGEALGRIDAGGIGGAGFLVHPALLDSCLQVIGAALPRAVEDVRRTYMPTAVEHVALGAPPAGDVLAHATIRASKGAGRHTADVVLTDEKGAVWGTLRGVRVERIERARVAQTNCRDWIHEVAWEEVPPTPRRAVVAGAPETWWILADDERPGASLRSILDPASCRLVEVRRGSCFAEVRDALFQATPRDGASFDQLWRAACERFGAPSRIVYAWGIDPPAPSGASGWLDETEERVTGAVHLTQSLVRAEFAGPQALWLVTRGAQPIPGRASPPDPRAAAMWGLGRAIAHEHVALFGGLLDLDATTPLSVVADHLLGDAVEDQTAYVGAHACVPRLVRTSVPARPGLRCAGDASYLITGGLGALGLQVAAWLVERGARHLVLTSRRRYAPHDRWPALAEGGNPTAMALLALEGAGAKVVVIAADAGDPGAMAEALAGAGGPPLRGVVHAAGVVTAKALVELTPDDLRADLLAKVAGTAVLDALTDRLPLDFFILFSSAAAIWGSRLLAGYGAANHFMDAFAHLRRATGRVTLSVNWALWGEGGMGVAGDRRSFLERTGLRPMSSEDALAALDMLIGAALTEATVADVDFGVFKPLFEQQPRRRLLQRLHVAKAAADRPAPAGEEPPLVASLRALPDPAAQRARIRAFVHEAAAAVLGLSPDKVRRDKALSGQGLDSLNANDLRGRLERALPVKVDILTLLKGDSTDRIGALLFDQLGAALDGGRPESAVARAPAAIAWTPDREELPDDIRPSAMIARAAARHLLLTGATGFLGAYVLADLFRLTDARVHCLVKAESDEAARARIRRRLEAAGLWTAGIERRIVPIAGDLGQPRLGLAEGRMATLAREIDQIFHAGYLVNFLLSYEDLRPANVGSLVELLRLAIRERPKPVHFVSSFSVLLTPEHAGRTVSDDETLHAGEGGYRQGKRACERLLDEARRRGITANIYRPPFIGWHPATGDYNDRDFLVRLIRGCLALGAAPDLDVVFYIAPVDFVSASICKLALDPNAQGRNFNVLTHAQGIRWPILVERIRRAGGALTLEPPAAWRARLAGAGPDNPLHPFFAHLESAPETGSAVLDLFHRSATPRAVDLRALRDRLGLIGDPPPLDEGSLRPFVQRLAAS